MKSWTYSLFRTWIRKDGHDDNTEKSERNIETEERLERRMKGVLFFKKNKKKKEKECISFCVRMCEWRWSVPSARLDLLLLVYKNVYSQWKTIIIKGWASFAKVSKKKGKKKKRKEKEKGKKSLKCLLANGSAGISQKVCSVMRI